MDTEKTAKPHKKFYKRLGKLITGYRQLADISQEDMAERLGITQATYSRYETGKLNINSHDLYKICKAANIDMLLAVTAAGKGTL